MDQTHKQPSDWWETQLTPLALAFARESVNLSDQEYEEITGQILEGCKPSPCAYKLAEAVIEIISRKRTEVRSRSGGGWWRGRWVTSLRSKIGLKLRKIRSKRLRP